MDNENMEKKDKNFAKFFHKIVDSGLLSKMNNKELRVYIVLNRFADYTSGRAYPSVKTITRLSGVNKNYIAETTKKLSIMGQSQE